MNFHSDEWIMNKLNEHLEEARQHFREDQIVGIFLQGSQNYGLDYESSDVDTKLIVLPTLAEIAFNKKPVSTTHVRANNEHIDFKDIRLYIQTFRKQNLNFLEILYTKYKWINPMYEYWWNMLVDNRELICRYNIPQAIKSMQGIAKEKYFAMEHEYPSKLDILAKYGYDPKQLHHLLRVENYLARYMLGESYETCLKPTNPELLLRVKHGEIDLESARIMGAISIGNIDAMVKQYLVSCSKEVDELVDELLDMVQGGIIKECLKREVMRSDNQ